MAIRMLLIDDNRDQVAITTRVLGQLDMRFLIDAASTAQEGLDKVNITTYDLILCDYRLPDLSGLEMLKRLKASGKDTPFILATAAGNERLVVDAMQLGASDYVVKDFSYNEVLPKIIRQVLERYQERKERERLEAERNEAIEALKKEKAALEKMNNTMLNREGRILELKQEINALLREFGRSPKYQA